MDFKPVLSSLKELFPQVDLHILEDVAVKHSKDVDAAALFVISEVLPSLSRLTKASRRLHNPRKLKHSPAKVRTLKDDSLFGRLRVEEENASLLPGPSISCENALCNDPTYNDSLGPPCMGEAVGEDSVVEVSELNESSLLLHHHKVVEEANVSLPSKLMTMTMKCKMALDTDHTPAASHIKLHSIDDAVAGASVSNVNIHHHLVPHEEPDEQETSVEHIVRACQGLTANEFGVMHANVQELFGVEGSGTATAVCTHRRTFSSSRGEESTEYGSAVEKDRKSECGEELPTCLADPVDIQKFNDRESNHTVSAVFTSDHDLSSSTLENCSDVMEYGHLVNEDTNISVPENELQLAENGAELLPFEREMVSVSESNEATTIAIRSSKIIGIDFLEELINDSENNKKTLVFALESLGNMVKEVELHEERARQATDESSKVGQVVLSKAEDLNQTLKHAKDTDDMQAGEVYGERAILATEARELQSRLLKLSDERDKSLLIIEEIRRTLEARLAAAAEEQAAAEQRKLIMVNIVQESERLIHEAEENYKLREFLVDRGRVVNVLQEELSVICEGVMLLKERVDGRLPPSKSLSSAAPILASSSTLSDCRSIQCDRVPQPQGPIESPEMIKEIVAHEHKAASLDDDWIIVDDSVEPHD